MPAKKKPTASSENPEKGLEKEADPGLGKPAEPLLKRPIERKRKKMFPLVGIGASAGRAGCHSFFFRGHAR